MEFSIFGDHQKYASIDQVAKGQATGKKILDETTLKQTPVELNCYYEVVENEPVQVKDIDDKVALDIKTFKSALTANSCSESTFISMVKLATRVKDRNGIFVLPVIIPPTYVPSRVTPADVDRTVMQDPPVDKPSGVSILLKPGAGGSSSSSKKDDSSVTEEDRKVYPYMAAFFLRYAYKGTTDMWEEKMNEFRKKYKDMMGEEFQNSTPTTAFINSLNDLARDSKERSRIIVYLTMEANKSINSMEESRAKVFRYLFVTPFAFYAMGPCIQLRKCADVMDLEPSKLLSALAVSELEAGATIIKDAYLSGANLLEFPFVRAFDERFLVDLSKLSCKKVLYVMLCILNLKGGQTRLINLDSMKTLAVVKDKPVLNSLVYDILTSIDMERAETNASKAIAAKKDSSQFRERRAMYMAAGSGPVSVMNQRPAPISSLSILKPPQSM
ncbi:TPA_asm: N [Alnus trirhavirus 1]|nr:TPA_asm: N [Alnus trirhavirus 1]